ncbi:MAG: hypothetical protein ACYDCO_07605 [Armatimonadota bacterium]
MTKIVVQYDPAAKTGFDLAAARQLPRYDNSPAMLVRQTVDFLQEGLKRMTGKEVPVVNQADISTGIVLTTLASATPELRKDPEVLAVLHDTGKDAYNYREAFLIRSEKNRLLVIANTVDGLAAAVPALLESVGYEILGMGPNWVYAPDFTARPLTFTINLADRPGYYLRMLWATSGQQFGIGTIADASLLTDPADEPVGASYTRWLVGTRMAGVSMPAFPGHQMQSYHRPVVEAMRETRTPRGFLAPKTTIAPDAQRPAAGKENAGELWINDDPAGQPGAGKVYLSYEEKWTELNPGELAATLDVSVPMVRRIIFDAMKAQAEKAFAEHPDEVFVFGTETEDGAGGYANPEKHAFDPAWYPNYRKAEGKPLGAPYVLHGYAGVKQPVESWNADSASNIVFGFNNWLLCEYDKWIDARPAAERVTATGKSKKALVRCSLYSYNYHDVPPDFNLDPRIRLMIAGYPKHRGHGKWKGVATQLEMAKAFQIMLPREPSGDYRIISLAAFYDQGTANIRAGWSASPASLVKDLRETYDHGIKAMCCEMDFNFARNGAGYYLYSKILWKPTMTVAEAEAIRERWLKKAFGSAWQEMKAYYDFMLPEHYPVNGPNTWVTAVRLLDRADGKLNGRNEPDVQRRIDDLKQFWYFHYLESIGEAKPDSPAFREYLWKGQMSYMFAMHAVASRYFKTSYIAEILDKDLIQGSAHYTHAETQVWWRKVLDHWPYTPVQRFSDLVLANGRLGGTVDLNDLVTVKEFQSTTTDTPYFYESNYTPATFLTAALRPGDPLGFKMRWPFIPNDNFYSQRDVSYGIEWWNPVNKAWEVIAEKARTAQPSSEVKLADGTVIQYCEVEVKAPKAGVYRFILGFGGFSCTLYSLGYDLQADKYTRTVPFTFTGMLSGYTQDPTYIYIPKGTKTLDLEDWGPYIVDITFYNDLPSTNPGVSRVVPISKLGILGKIGTFTIALEPGEDGTVAMIRGNRLAFPYLYSVPIIWAKSPSALLVPRGIAQADGLTILE